MICYPRYIFIDWNKTLSFSLFWEHLKGDHPHAHLLPVIEQWLFRDHREIIDPWMRGEYSTREVISQMATGIQVSESVLMTELVESCQNMKLCSNEIPALIRSVRRKEIGVGIATDNMDTFREFTIPALHLDSLFDDFLISSELGILKEDTKGEQLVFFDSFLKKNCLRYNQVVLLDDSLDKIGTYKRFGFERFLIDGVDSLVRHLREYAT